MKMRPQTTADAASANTPRTNTLPKNCRDCMKNPRPHRIGLPADIIRRACSLPIERMLEISARPLENAG